MTYYAEALEDGVGFAAAAYGTSNPTAYENNT